MEIISKTKNASFEMDTKHALVEGEKACEFSYLYQCVMGKGNIEILDNENDKVHGLEQIMKHYSDREGWEFDSKIVDKIYVLKLLVKEWSCKEH